MNAFSALAIIAIITGGMLSAFSARTPSRFIMWATAYLVLVVGIVQLGLVFGWQLLELPHTLIGVSAFILFNLGNSAVLWGRWLKGRKESARIIVYIGGVLLAISMMLLGGAALSAHPSWALFPFLTLVVIVLVSMPIGLVLSTRPHKG